VLRRAHHYTGGQKTFMSQCRWKKWVFRAHKKRPLELVSMFLFNQPEGVWYGYTEENLMAIKRVHATDVIGVASALPQNLGSWGKRYPLLVERMVTTTYEDGTRRTKSRPSIEYGNQGSWVITLTEPDTALMIQAEMDQPDDWLMCLEGLLACPNPPWQHCPWLKAKPARKAKN